MNTQILTLTAVLILATGAAFAAESRAGMHQMPDGTWMNNHAMMPADAAKPADAPAAKPAAGSQTVVATVNGLVCDFCAQSVQKTLTKEPGVAGAQVDLSAKTVTVALKPGASLAKDRLASLLKDAGYDLTGYRVQ